MRRALIFAACCTALAGCGKSGAELARAQRETDIHAEADRNLAAFQRAEAAKADARWRTANPKLAAQFEHTSAKPETGSVAAQYPPPWRSSDEVKLPGSVGLAVARSLGQNGASDCGIYYYRPDAADEKALIYCTPDAGEPWHSYIADLRSYALEGPHRPVAGVTKPVLD